MLPGARMFFESAADGAAQYIEVALNANAYITTPIVHDTNTVVKFSAMFMTSADNPQCAMVGSTNGWTGNYLLWVSPRSPTKSNPGAQWHFGGRSSGEKYFTADVRTDFELGRTVFKMGATVVPFTGGSNPGNGSIMIFACKNAYNRAPFCRLYSFEILKSGTSVWNGVPWQSAGRFGLYDTVGEKFYASEGADKFKGG